MRKMIWLACLSYLVIGMAHVAAGSILEPMMARYGLDYRDGGQFIMNQFLGFLVGVLIAPWVSTKIGKRNTILLALGSLTLAEAAYSLLLPWEWMLSIAPLAGFGFGMTETVIGALVIEYVEEKKATTMTQIEMFFGVGALLMPVIAALFIKTGVWQLSFPVITAVAGLTTLLWLVLSFGKVDDLIAYRPPQAEQETKDHQPLKVGYNRMAGPFLVLGILFFCIYVGMEMSFSNYLPSIMIQRTGVSEASAASTMGLFWAMMAIGRLFAGRLAERAGYGRFLIIAVAAGAIVFTVSNFTKDINLSLVLIGLNGLIWAGVFAIGLVYVNQFLPGRTERTTSLLVASGGLGGALFPKLSGWTMDNASADWTLILYAGMAGVMVLLMITMVISARKLKRPANSLNEASK
ncbi:MFS transporter [Paenibacillaceae bacterium]|nr:MFS transporter [Paenibacillaceae bacterium]